MKTSLLFILLFIYVCIVGHHYRTIMPRGEYFVGETIQANDIYRGHFWSTDTIDYATDVRSIVGHKALKPLHAGAAIHLSDVN